MSETNLEFVYEQKRRIRRRCEGQAWSREIWHYHQCGNPAIITRNGTHYCWFHDPGEPVDDVYGYECRYKNGKVQMRRRRVLTIGPRNVVFASDPDRIVLRRHVIFDRKQAIKQCMESARAKWIKAREEAWAYARAYARIKRG